MKIDGKFLVHSVCDCCAIVVRQGGRQLSQMDRVSASAVNFGCKISSVCQGTLVYRCQSMFLYCTNSEIDISTSLAHVTIDRLQPTTVFPRYSDAVTYTH